MVSRSGWWRVKAMTWNTITKFVLVAVSLLVFSLPSVGNEDSPSDVRVELDSQKQSLHVTVHSRSKTASIWRGGVCRGENNNTSCTLCQLTPMESVSTTVPFERSIPTTEKCQSNRTRWLGFVSATKIIEFSPKESYCLKRNGSPPLDKWLF
jgi:hypothetical protein